MRVQKSGFPQLFCRVLGFVGVAVLLAMSPMVVVAADEIAPTFSSGHSTVGTAQKISTNNPVTDNLPSSSAKNWYQFTIEEDGYVSFTYDSEYNANGSWEHALYDSAQNLIRVGTWKASWLEPVTSVNYGLGKGTYYVCMYAANSYTYYGGNYTMTVNYTAASDWEREFNDSPATADELGLGSHINGNIMTTSDLDYYHFTLNQDGYVTFGFDHPYVGDSNSLWQLAIYDGKLKRVASERFRGAILEPDSSLPYGLKRGEYYALLTCVTLNTGGYDHSNHNYKLSLNFTAASDWENEPNNDIENVTTYPVNTFIYGNITTTAGQWTSDDVDYFRFEVPEDGQVSITLSHEYVEGAYNYSYYWRAQLLDSSYEEIINAGFYENERGSKTSKAYVVEKGIYYIKLSGYYVDDSVYSVRLDFSDKRSMYRLYNQNSGEHFYTSNETERDALITAGWRYEGVAWEAPYLSKTPVYRLYNPNAGDHHYTPDLAERDVLIGIGWKYEGIGWYSDDAQATPLYRLYNPNATGAGAHHYTVSAGERDFLIGSGWNDEGIGWYGK